MEKIIKLRRDLHKNPEVSNKEFSTSKRIEDFMNQYSPDELIRIGETGLAYVYKGNNSGKTIVFRAELDALPIKEKNNIPHISSNEGVAHLCGHDGHMAIIVALAKKISDNRPKNGNLVLLFQPAEETEHGTIDGNISEYSILCFSFSSFAIL